MYREIEREREISLEASMRAQSTPSSMAPSIVSTSLATRSASYGQCSNLILLLLLMSTVHIGIYYVL